jgi:hypothetical protein
MYLPLHHPPAPPAPSYEMVSSAADSSYETIADLRAITSSRQGSAWVVTPVTLEQLHDLALEEY